MSITLISHPVGAAGTVHLHSAQGQLADSPALPPAPVTLSLIVITPSSIFCTPVWSSVRMPLHRVGGRQHTAESKLHMHQRGAEGRAQAPRSDTILQAHIRIDSTLQYRRHGLPSPALQVLGCKLGNLQEAGERALVAIGLNSRSSKTWRPARLAAGRSGLASFL